MCHMRENDGALRRCCALFRLLTLPVCLSNFLWHTGDGEEVGAGGGIFEDADCG